MKIFLLSEVFAKYAALAFCVGCSKAQRNIYFGCLLQVDELF